MKFKIFFTAIYFAVLFTIWPPLWAGPSVKAAVYLTYLGLVDEHFAPTLGEMIWIFPFVISVALFVAWGIWKLYEHDNKVEP